MRLPDLLQMFAGRFYFSVDEIIPIVEGKVYNSYEIRFGSFYCQSMSAHRLIEGNAQFQERAVTVTFGRDPCDVQPELPRAIWGPFGFVNPRFA